MTEPALRIDVVVLTLTADDPRTIRVLLRGGSDGPADMRLLPGDALAPDEGLDHTARRILDQVGLAQPRHLEQLASFGEPDRVPSQRTVSITYLALVPQPFRPSGDAAWAEPSAAADLAWDHGAIVLAAIDRVRSKLSYSTIAFALLPDEFTMSELQDVYEAVLGTQLDKRNFRKKVRSLGVLLDTGAQRRGPHRPAALFTFADQELVLLDDVIAST